MALAVAREVALVRAPAHFTRLAAFTNEAIDRPGVDELAKLLRSVRHLRVAFGDVHNLHAQAPRELAPLGARAGRAGVDLRVGGDVEQRLLEEMRYQPGIGAVGEHRGGRTRVPGPQRQRLIAQRIVGAPARRHGRIGIAARPRLDAGVEIHRAFFPA